MVSASSFQRAKTIAQKHHLALLQWHVLFYAYNMDNMDNMDKWMHFTMNKNDAKAICKILHFITSADRVQLPKLYFQFFFSFLAYLGRRKKRL